MNALEDTKSSSMARAYSCLLEEITQGRPAAMVTYLGGSPPEKTPIREDFTAFLGFTGPDRALWPAIQEAFSLGAPTYIPESEQGPVLVEPCFPAPQLIVLGGGHIAVPLAEMASKTGFIVTVVDDRPSFACPKRFPTARYALCQSFEGCLDQLNLGAHSYVVIITRGHRHDLTCLRQALGHNLAYTGMIGSRRRVGGVRNLLLSEGFDQRALDRVNAPIGLDIGAITPEEIAVSILAQIIKAKRQGASTPAAARQRRAEFDIDVIRYLAGRSKPTTEHVQPGDSKHCYALSDHPQTGNPAAIVTVIRSQGSTPRKAGAKMLVWAGGTTLGSIGGGYVEAEVTAHAHRMISVQSLTGDSPALFQACRVELNADLAADEGMVCGGVMEILIEAPFNL